MTGKQVVTVVDAQVSPEREADFLAGYQRLTQEPQPEALLRSELLRGQDGAWRIQTTWHDFDALQAVRRSGKPPAALALLESVGAEHTHGWFTVEQDYQPTR